jgi:thymidylate synthase
MGDCAYLRLVGDAMSAPGRRVFGRQMRFDLTRGAMPLLTTKKMFWRGIVEELAWFVRGSTDSNELRVRGVHIWDADGAATDGDLGPMYGFQWRHSGAEYRGCGLDYSGEGVDQLQQCIDALKSDPTSRRILMCAWNPSDIPKMALPPCHVLCQWLVDRGRLTCLVYQRSGDIGLGIPFNIASYSLLTHAMAHVTGLRAYELIHTIGDAHIYPEHVRALRTQLNRVPMCAPVVRISGPTLEIAIEGAELVGYQSHDALPMPMVVSGPQPRRP